MGDGTIETASPTPPKERLKIRAVKSFSIWRGI
jgi:hypothetical protein